MLDGAVRRGAAPCAALFGSPLVFGIKNDLVAQMDELTDSEALVAAIDLFWRADCGPVPFYGMSDVMAHIGALDHDRGRKIPSA